MSKTLKGFITYSHEDIEAKNELRKRLAVMEQQNELVTWDDGQLTPGDKALQENILKEGADSDLLLYLASAASLVFHPVSNYRLLGFDPRGISMLGYAILAVEGRDGKERYSEPQ